MQKKRLIIFSLLLVSIFIVSGCKEGTVGGPLGTQTSTLTKTKTPAAGIVNYGDLVISATPDGADIYIDEAYFGKLARDVPFVIQGFRFNNATHTIKVKKEGYKTYNKIITLRPRQPVSINVQLNYVRPTNKINLTLVNNTTFGSADKKNISRLIQTRSSCQDSGGKVCEDYQVCNGIILSVTDSNRCCKGDCKLPKYFDWRNRHGENWNTPVKDQGFFGSCQTFAKTSAQEARINLYYNQHIDVDLSEQYLLDCGGPSVDGDYVPPPPLGVFPFADYYPACSERLYNCPECIFAAQSRHFCPGSEYCAQEIHGIVDESCYRPYVWGSDAYQCKQENICDDWEQRLWKIKGHRDYILSSENPEYPNCSNLEIVNSKEQIKIALMKYGPLISTYEPWGHIMVLSGYKEPDIWIFKNSWGEFYGDNGYLEIQSVEYPSREYYGFTGEVICPASENCSIKCVDKDNDGFCNWGISANRPTICPSSCKFEKDWDDSDVSIGALDLMDMEANYDCNRDIDGICSPIIDLKNFDFDGNGCITIEDDRILWDEVFKDEKDRDKIYDVNKDGSVNFYDLEAIQKNIGRCLGY